MSLEEETRSLLVPNTRTASGEGSSGSSLPSRSSSQKGLLLPISRSCSGKIAGFAILLTLTLERLAFYSLTGNLYLYLNHRPLGWMPYNAMTAFYVFNGVSELMAIFGGWLADSVLGKFKTVLLGLLCYAGAYSVFAFVASYGQMVPPICYLSVVPLSNVSTPEPWIDGAVVRLYTIDADGTSSITVSDDHDGLSDGSSAVTVGLEHCGGLIYVVLLTTGVSVGMLRPNIAPFGAEQFQDVSSDTMRRFFNWYYWCINIGSFVALGVMGYVQQAFANGFFISYLTATASLGVAMLVFVSVRPLYVVHKPGGSVLGNILKILREACRSRRRRKMNVERQRSTLRIDLPSSSETSVAAPSWLDMAKVKYGGSFHESAVEDVKSLGKVTIIFLALIPYWIVYFQMQTGFVAQGLHMKLNPATNHTCENGTSTTVVDGSFKVPPVWLSLFDVIFLLILIPVMDRIVYPFLDRHHIRMGLLFKMSLGMAFALISVAMAGGLEFYRLYLIDSDRCNLIAQDVGNSSYAAADLLVFWQAPQYAFIGISEVFASVASLEFAYSQSPKSMQGIIMGLHYVSCGVGSFMGTGLLELVRPYWFTSEQHGNLNISHLDYYFFLLGGIQLVTIVVFNLVAKKCNIDDGGGMRPADAATLDSPGRRGVLDDQRVRPRLARMITTQSAARS